MNADDKIRAILQMEADAVDPSPAGWDAIQQGIASRRPRRWWTAGAALAGAAAVFVGVTAFVAVNDADRGVRGVRPDAPPAGEGTATATPPAPLPTASPVVPPADPEAFRPTGAIWPLTTNAELAEWRADPDSMPALKTSRGAATAFATRYLRLAEPRVVGEERFGVSELVIRAGSFTVTTVTVKGFGPEGTAPFAVTHAESEALRITSPAPGAIVPRTFTARGTYEGVEPAIRVELLGDTGGVARSGATSETRADAGPQGWTALASLGSEHRTGSMLVTLRSNRDGSIASAAAIPLAFRAAGPEALVAAREGRIAVLSTATGEVVRWLTEAVPGAGAHDPELSDDGKTVVYAQATGTCSAEIRSVPVTGGAPTTLVSGEGRVSHPSRRRGVLTYLRTACEAGDPRREIVVRSGGRVEALPAPETGPALGARYVAYVAEDGSLRQYDVLGDLPPTDTAAPTGCHWTAAAWGEADAEGHDELLAAARCTGAAGTESRIYRVPERSTPDLVAAFQLPLLTSLDLAGAHIVTGSGERAYSIEGDRAREIPGVAQRPTWS